MSRKDEIEQLIVKHNRTLQILKEQRASFGSLQVPPHVLIHIEDTEVEIDNLKAELEELEDNSVDKKSPRNQLANSTNSILGISLRASDKLISLPPKPGYCFGRKNEINKLVQTLLELNPRAIPILGPPGIGKSTVSLVGLHDEEVVRRYNDRRFFVRCDGVTSYEMLVLAVAKTLGLSYDLSVSNIPKIQMNICNELERAPAVLVLDNAETPWWTDTAPVEDFLAVLSNINQVALVVSIRGSTRPHGTAWCETISIGALNHDSARQAFLEEVGKQEFQNNSLVDVLVEKVDRVPLAIILMACAVQAYDNLQIVLELWEKKRLRLERYGKMKLDVSLAISIESPRMRDSEEGQKARRLLEILALLPDGLDRSALDEILPNSGIDAERILLEVGLAFVENGRLRVLSPIRESVAKNFKPTQLYLSRLIRYFLHFANKYGPFLGTEEGAKSIEKLMAEISNLEEIFFLGLEQEDPSPSLEAIINVANVTYYTGRAISRVLEHARDIALQRQDDYTFAYCNKHLATHAMIRADYENAQKYTDKALEFFGKDNNNMLEMAHCITRLGEIQIINSEYELAKTNLERAREIYNEANYPSGQGDAIKRLGDVYREQGQYYDAKRYYEEANSYYYRINNILGQADCIQQMAHCDLAKHNHPEAHSRYKKAIDLYIAVGDTLGQSNCIKGLGDIEFKLKHYEIAKQYYQQSDKYYQVLNNKVCLANTRKAYADIARDEQNFSEAILKYKDALNLYKAARNKMGEAYCTKSLADAYLSASDYSGAEKHFRDALDLFTNLHHKEPSPVTRIQQAACIKGQGDIAFYHKDYNLAKKLYLEVLPIFQNEDDALGEAYCLKSLGDVELLLDTPQYELAVEQFVRAAELSQKFKDQTLEATCLLRSGQSLLANHDTNGASRYFWKALDLFKEIKDQQGVEETRQLINKVGKE